MKKYAIAAMICATFTAGDVAPAYAIACAAATDTKLPDCAIVCAPMTIGGWPWGVAAYSLCL